MTDEVRDDKVHGRRRLPIVLALAAFAAFSIFLLVWWMKPTREITRSFESAKITAVHVDEEPFMRVDLAEGQTYRPIDLMAGTTVLAECEVMSLADHRRFTLTAFGRTYEGSDCGWDVAVPEDLGVTGEFVFRFYDGDATEMTDSINVPVTTVQRGERMAFQGLEDEAKKTIQSVNVPQKVYVYGKAATHLERPRDTVALFFVADPLVGVPIAQLKPMDRDDKTPQLVTGDPARYRTWGKEMEGYAFWTSDPIELGDASDRKVLDIYMGIFPREDPDALLKRFLKVELKGNGVLSVTPLVNDVPSLRRLTVGGRLLSQPLHVVRGGMVVDVAPPKPQQAPAP